MASKTVQPGSQLPEDLVSILDDLGKTETDARQLVESISFRRDSAEQIGEALRLVT